MSKGVIKYSILILCLSLVICPRGNVVATELSEFAHKIAFLRQGEIWISDKGGRGIKQITKTTGKIEDFLFSPTLKYLCYSEIIKYVDEPGWWEEGEKIAQRAVCSIVIMELKGRKVLKEIMPPEGNWIYPAKWSAEDKLLFYGASGFDVWGFFEYDAQEGIEGEIDYREGSILLNADFHKDGLLMAYVDYSGVGEEFKEDLHLVDLRSNDDRILLSKRSILEPRISSDTRNVAFVEVEYVEKQGFDNLWIYRIKDGSLTKLYRGPAKAKTGGVSQLSWSPDDRHIGMFFSPKALILEIQDPSNIHGVRGIDFGWIENRKIIFGQGNNIYLYNLDTGKRELFFEDASKPVFLWQKN